MTIWMCPAQKSLAKRQVGAEIQPVLCCIQPEEEAPFSNASTGVLRSSSRRGGGGVGDEITKNVGLGM